MSTYSRYFHGGVSKETLHKVIGECRSTPFPLINVLDEQLLNWFKAVSWSRNTKPEFVLLSCLGVISSLLGCNTKILIREGSRKDVVHARKSYTEPPQLYLTMLSEPGSGKSNAQNLAVDEPLLDQDHEILNSLIVQEYTRKGLFDHLHHHGGMGLISLSEIQSFYEQLVKKQGDGAGERQLFNKLHDGSAPWLKSSAARCKSDETERRECINSNCLAICGFAQPQPFIDLYKEMARFNDGFIDRLLICSITPKLLKESELSFWDRELDKYNIHSFHCIYKAIFDIHQSGTREYKFDKEASEGYKKISDETVDKLMNKWSGNEISFDCSSKDKRNLSRIALSLHVLKNTLTKALDVEGDNINILPDDIPIEIDSRTLKASKAIMDYMVTQREALHLALVNDQAEGKKKKQDTFTPSADFPEILTSWIENVCSKIDISSFMILRNDGIVMRLEDCTANVPFDREMLQNELSLHARRLNLSLSFAGKKRRSLDRMVQSNLEKYKTTKMKSSVKGPQKVTEEDDTSSSSQVDFSSNKIHQDQTQGECASLSSQINQNTLPKNRGASSSSQVNQNTLPKNRGASSSSQVNQNPFQKNRGVSSSSQVNQNLLRKDGGASSNSHCASNIIEYDGTSSSGNSEDEDEGNILQHKADQHRLEMALKRKTSQLHDALSKNEAIEGKRRKRAANN